MICHPLRLHWGKYSLYHLLPDEHICGQSPNELNSQLVRHLTILAAITATMLNIIVLHMEEGWLTVKTTLSRDYLKTWYLWFIKGNCFVKLLKDLELHIERCSWYGIESGMLQAVSNGNGVLYQISSVSTFELINNWRGSLFIIHFITHPT